MIILYKALKSLADQIRNNSQDNFNLNCKMSNLVNAKIEKIQTEAAQGLYSSQKESIMDIGVAATLNQRQMRAEIRQLDINQPQTEITEIGLDRGIIESEMHKTRLIGILLNQFAGDLGPKYNKLVELRDGLDLANKSLADNYKNNAQQSIILGQLIANDNGASLIDDYANPNMDMPSYMDPED